MAEEVKTPTRAFSEETLKTCTMTKKRYNQIKEECTSKFNDKELVEEFLTIIERVLKFDPNKKYYNEKSKINTQRYRQKKQQETGLSCYKLFDYPRLQRKKSSQV